MTPIFQPRSITNARFDLSKVKKVVSVDKFDCSNGFLYTPISVPTITITFEDDSLLNLSYLSDDISTRDQDHRKMLQLLSELNINYKQEINNTNNQVEKKEKNHMGLLSTTKEYFEKNKDMIFTIGLVILIDQFVFHGAFRERLKNLVESLLNKTEKQLSGKKESA